MSYKVYIASLHLNYDSLSFSSRTGNAGLYPEPLYQNIGNEYKEAKLLRKTGKYYDKI